MLFRSAAFFLPRMHWPCFHPRFPPSHLPPHTGGYPLFLSVLPLPGNGLGCPCAHYLCPLCIQYPCLSRFLSLLHLSHYVSYRFLPLCGSSVLPVYVYIAIVLFQNAFCLISTVHPYMAFLYSSFLYSSFCIVASVSL